MHSFRIRGLPAEQFTHLFTMSQADLAEHCAIRVSADGDGYPCRISLTDATAGDEVLLVNYQHHRTSSPFRSSFAVYVRQGERTYDAIDAVPEQLRRRLLSLRAYDASGMMRAAEVVEGTRVETVIDSLLQESSISYIHAHFAKPGCYAALIERAG
jgi:hypothetical protein